MKITSIDELAKKIMEALIKAKFEYKQETDKRKNNLLAEIRDDLTIILGCSELLASTKNTSEDKLWALKNLNGSVRKIIDKLEEYFKLQESK